MSNVYDLTARRLAKAPKSLSDLVESAIEYICSDWEKMSKKNSLNEFFKSSVPSHLITDNVNYIGCLDAIAAVEQNLDMLITVSAPGAMSAYQLGWVVEFKLAGKLWAVPRLPIHIQTESKARCFAVLVFLKVKRDGLAAKLC